MNQNKSVTKSVLWGSLGSLLLFGLYLGILTFANSFKHAIDQFIIFLPWMSVLVLGFGIQVGMFSYMRLYRKSVIYASSTGAVTATGGVSAGSMVVCCLHHFTDVLPILGLSAAAMFLIKYQSFFLDVGIFSNLVGITFMLHTMQKHSIYFKDGFLEKIMRINMKKLLIVTSLIGGIILLVQLGLIILG